MPPPPARANTVFLNIPYDNRFRRLYVAYLVGLIYLGLKPRVTLGLPGGRRRLDTDPHIHDGTAEGVMRELCNAFVRSHARPAVPQMLRACRTVTRQLPTILQAAGARTVFEARVFADLCLAAGIAADQLRTRA